MTPKKVRSLHPHKTLLYNKMKLLPLLFVALLAFAQVAAWFVNFYKVTQCDFEAPYKSEVLHGLGVFCPPAAIITVWFDSN